MTARLSRAENFSRKKELFESYLPRSYSDIEGKMTHLPYYRNCFVCGVERSVPGLERSFFLSTKGADKIIVAPAGLDRADADYFYVFQKEGYIHPVSLIALLDESLGWAGFMKSSSGAVTTRISYTFYRPVKAHEVIVVFARGERLRKTNTRLMFWASGGAAVLRDSGELETVCAAEGQWLGVAQLTEQMKTSSCLKSLRQWLSN